jgi:tight adherence protein B
VRMFITAVLIQRESGGNLAENLDNLSNIIRERFKFRRTLRTHTAQGRMTGYILALAPLVAGLGMWVVNPSYESLLVTEPWGRIMLISAFFQQIIGFLIIRRIVDIEF